MNIVESNKIEKTILVFIEIDLLNKNEKLENSYEEFHSLVQSSGTKIVSSFKFKQRIHIFKLNNYVNI